MRPYDIFLYVSNSKNILLWDTEYIYIKECALQFPSIVLGENFQVQYIVQIKFVFASLEKCIYVCIHMYISHKQSQAKRIHM